MADKDKTYNAREHHQDLIIKLKVCTDDMIKEIKNDLEKDNMFNCLLAVKTLELLTNFVIVDAQLNHIEKEQRKEKGDRLRTSLSPDKRSGKIFSLKKYPSLSV